MRDPAAGQDSVSTLILVDRKALADQWRSRIREFMDEKCGQIGGGRAKTTGRIDVALLPTLARRDNVAELTAGYGFLSSWMSATMSRPWHSAMS